MSKEITKESLVVVGQLPPKGTDERHEIQHLSLSREPDDKQDKDKHQRATSETYRLTDLAIALLRAALLVQPAVGLVGGTCCRQRIDGHASADLTGMRGAHAEESDGSPS